MAETWVRRAAAALVLAALLQGAAAQDLVLFHAHVFTAEPAHPYAEAVALRGDTILAVGTRAEVERVAVPDARRVDLQGRFLMPGMIDAHAHPVSGGVQMGQANLDETQGSLPHLLQFVSDRVDAHESLLGDVLVVNNVDTGFWARAVELEAALSTGRYAAVPMVLYGWDGHSSWVNRALRERVGLTRAALEGMSPGERRYYGHDAALEPDGVVMDNGMPLVDRRLPQPSLETLLAAGRYAVHYMNGLGITGWLEASACGYVGETPATLEDPGYLPAYRALAQAGELTAHVAAYPVVRPAAGTQQLDVVERMRALYALPPELRIPGVKLFVDGVVEFPLQTAALLTPYRNSGRVTPPLIDARAMTDLVVAADARGMTVHMHAIGDAAVRQALDAVEAARRAHPGGRLPHAIAHVEFAAPQDVPRFAATGTVAALQLLWATADSSTIDIVQPYVDPATYAGIYRARALLDAGALIAGSSDWPITSANPFEAIYQAETRTGPQGVLDAGERMPREAMLYAYTRNAAIALDALDRIGTLAPGKRADLVLLDRDVLTVPAEEMRGTQVIWTLYGGRAVHGEGP